MVGDDAQSIYSFRAATVRNILDFPGQFSPRRRHRDARPQLSLDAADPGRRQWGDRTRPRSASPRICGRSASRRSFRRIVSVRDEADQARYIVERVLENRETGASLKQQAVLFRASHHSGPLELELTRRNIPFVKFGGLKFLDSAHVKDMLAVLRFAENPRDRVAGFRIMQLNARRRAVDGAARPRPDGRATPIRFRLFRRFRRRRARATTGPASSRRFNIFARARPAGPPRSTCARRWYEPRLERIHDDAAARLADLLQLEQIASGYPSRERFLTELTLDPPDATSDRAGAPLLDEDYLILSTIHSAKGQEWKSVFVLNAVDGCIPSDLGAGRRRKSKRSAGCSMSP